MKKETKKTFLGAGRVAFLARKAAIEKMIGEGYPLIFIYEKHSRELNISYSQFARYVRKFIRSSTHETERINPALPDEAVETGIDPSSPPKKKPAIKQESEQDESDARKKFEKDAEEGDFF